MVFDEFCSWCAKHHYAAAPDPNFGVGPWEAELHAGQQLAADPTDEILARLRRVAEGSESAPTRATDPSSNVTLLLERNSDSSGSEEEEEHQAQQEQKEEEKGDSTMPTVASTGDGCISAIPFRDSDSDGDDSESDTELSEDDVAVAIFNRLQEASSQQQISEEAAQGDRDRVAQLLGELDSEEEVQEEVQMLPVRSPRRVDSDGLVHFQGDGGGATAARSTLEKGTTRSLCSIDRSAMTVHERLYAERNKMPIDSVDLSKHGLDAVTLELRGQTEAMRAQLVEQAKLEGSGSIHVQRSIDAAEKRQQLEKERRDMRMRVSHACWIYLDVVAEGCVCLFALRQTV